MARKPLVFSTAFSVLTEKRLIGTGGAGRVYQCTDQDGAVWAVKVLDPARASTEKLKRFRNEYTFCVRHPHRNIVGVTDAGVVALDDVKLPFFVMPYFPKSLRELLEEKLAPDTALKLYGQILDGVEAAHLCGAIHRDLKPENILCDPSHSTLVIADFGIAQFAEDDLYTLVETGPTTRLANFIYAAPEQRARGRRADRRADIYALGLMLNELFTGDVPHGTAYRTIASVAPQYAYLDDLVARMLAQQPDDRPSSIEVVKAELIARGQAFIERQKLDDLRQTVIPTREISNLLIEDPPTLVGVNWKEGTLTLKLSRPVNQDWVWCLQHMGGYQSMARQPPEAFSFRGDEARVQATASDSQHVINYFKRWLPVTNRVYEERVRKAAQEKEERERADLRARIAAAEETERINRDLLI